MDHIEMHIAHLQTVDCVSALKLHGGGEMDESERGYGQMAWEERKDELLELLVKTDISVTTVGLI